MGGRRLPSLETAATSIRCCALSEVAKMIRKVEDGVAAFRAFRREKNNAETARRGPLSRRYPLRSTVFGWFGVVILAYAGWVSWTLLDHSAASERTADRRALEQRAATLAAHAWGPGPALSCLAGMSGEQVETACENAVFATPDTVAAAVTYVAAQMALLADALEVAQRNDANYDAVIAPVRGGLETDRFGIVAHVMLQREDCSVDQCEALALLHDANHVRSNLRYKPFNALVAKYAPSWAHARIGPLMADLSKIAPSPTGGPSGVPVSSKYDFPSSASIPPVNIMSSEPAAPPIVANALAASAAGTPSAASRRGRTK
jgi:hypothetical protein